MEESRTASIEVTESEASFLKDILEYFWENVEGDFRVDMLIGTLSSKVKTCIDELKKDSESSVEI